MIGQAASDSKNQLVDNIDQSTQLLRFTTAGSVDDGKSTLIGRLLYDSKSIFEDQYEAIKATSERRGEEGVNLALLTDGLKAEREQGITIDVAYRYFATPRRKFIIADTPGHTEYTRNMVTGASTADVALILIDARHGMVEQTRRHAFIASLLNIPHLIVCINKMDLMDYSEKVYNDIKEEFSKFSIKLAVKDIHFIPISALLGDNVVDRSKNMNWFEGSTLLYSLENIHTGSDHNFIDCRFPVQYVVESNEEQQESYKGYAGRIAGGVFKKGDEVMVLPSGFTSKIAKINTYDGEVKEAFPPMSVSLVLEDDLELDRGGMIVRAHNIPKTTQDIEAMICWFSDKALDEDGNYVLMHTTQNTKCKIKEVLYKLDINTLHRNKENRNIGMNDIARIVLRSTKPIFVDSYSKNRITGSFILINEETNNTVGAGMIL